MISGGLNGGALTIVLTIAVLCAAILLVCAMVPVIEAIVGLGIALFSGLLAPIGIVVLAKLVFWSIALIGIFDQWCNMFEAYNQYLQTGDLDAAESAARQARIIGYWSLAGALVQKHIVNKCSVVDKACAWQTCEEYPNADDWIEITLYKGDTVRGGELRDKVIFIRVMRS